MDGRRIVLLGKTGVGKSSAANTIFGEDVFKINHTANPGTSQCQKEKRSVNGRSITLIDTPGFFDPCKSKEDMKPEMVRCITECAPGPHAFLIVLKVQKHTDHEKQVIDQIRNTFSEKTFKYAAVVFTHGDLLPEGMKIEKFVHENQDLNDLVEKCGGRCHVVDNKYWKIKQQDEYRSNQFQVAGLLNTIDKIVKENNGDCYNNEMLQTLGKLIQTYGKEFVLNTLKNHPGITIAVLLGALCGASAFVIAIAAAAAAVAAAAAGAAAGAAIRAAGGAAGGEAGGGAAGGAAGGAGPSPEIIESNKKQQ